MTRLSICTGSFSSKEAIYNRFKGIKYTTLLLVTLFLAACSDATVRTEAEYITVATEAHAAGDSRLAILELSAGIRNFPRNADLQLLRGKIFLDLEDGSAAEIAFNKAIALGYNPDFIKHELAESWLYQRNPSKIIDRLEKELQQGSNNALIYEIVGRAYIASRDRSNPTLFIENMNIAERYIQRAYDISPNNTRVLISKAWVSALTGKLDEALDWLNKADAIVKDQRENLAVMAELLIRQDKIDLAQDVYHRLVKKYPQYPQYKVELGYSYLLQGNYDKSREWIEPIATRYPKQIRVNYLLSNISLMERKYADAKTLSDAVLTLAPSNLEASLINGASSYFLDDFENAHQKLSLFYNRTGSISALKLLVATQLKLNDNAAAAKLLEDAGQTAENQTDAELLNLVALASAKIGKTDVALEAYQKLAEQMPDAQSFQNNIGLLQIAQGNYDEGFANLEKALRADDAKMEPEEILYALTNKALQVQQYDKAAQYITDYKNIAGDKYKPWVMSAVLQTTLKNNAGARQDFEKAMEIAPDVAEIKARYAIFEKMHGNQDKALSLAHQAIKLDPSDIGSGKLLLDDLIKDKNFEEAKKIVDTAVQNDKVTDFSKMLFADYYTVIGQPQETLKNLNQLPAAIKATASYQLISGKAYLRNGQAQNAVAMLEPFSNNNPNNIQALKLLMRGYLLTGDQRKYHATLEKIDGLTPNDYENQIELAKLYISTGKNDQAEKILNRLKPANIQLALQQDIIKATMETNRGNVNAALAILTPLYEQYPNVGAISMLYARNLAKNDQYNDAVNVTKTWADKNPKNIAVRQFLGDLYMRGGDNDKARQQYEDMLAIKDNITKKTALHAHNNLAMVYLADNQDKKALGHAQRALDIAPNNPAIIDTYAQVLMKQGQAEKAVNHFNQALALLPTTDRKNRSAFTLGKANALVLSGQKEQARKILERLIKDDPDFSQMAAVKQLLSEL